MVSAVPAVKVAPPAPEAVAVASGRLAYRVTLGDRVAIVVAAGVVDAARQAEAAGDVKGIELLGEVLG